MKQTLTLLLAILAALTTQAARIDTLSISTRYMPSPMQVTVITPDRAAAGEECNTVYLLNGYDGNHMQWLGTQPQLPSLADRYGMIMVLPDGRDSWYWDSPADTSIRMETFIIDQLVPYIDRLYPTARDAKHRAITGLSMGGHGALWIAMRHPDVFANAGSMSGAVDLTGYVGKYKTTRLLGDTTKYKARWKDYSVMSLVPTLEPGRLNIIIDCGIKDPFAPLNERLHQALVERGIDHDYTSRPGTHSHAYWANSILYHLLYFNTAFSK